MSCFYLHPAHAVSGQNTKILPWCSWVERYPLFSDGPESFSSVAFCPLSFLGNTFSFSTGTCLFDGWILPLPHLCENHHVRLAESRFILHIFTFSFLSYISFLPLPPDPGSPIFFLLLLGRF